MTAAGVPEWASSDYEWLRSRWGKWLDIGFDRRSGKFTASAGIGEVVRAEQYAAVLDSQLAERSAGQSVAAVKAKHGA